MSLIDRAIRKYGAKAAVGFSPLGAAKFGDDLAGRKGTVAQKWAKKAEREVKRLLK